MNSNLAAFLAVIRACEGTADQDGYRRLFGGRLFDSYADHPRIVVSASGYKSTAAGAYQALAGTWDDFCKAKGPHDFSPASQDEFALWCITRRKAMDDVLAGRLTTAITKCSNEWASLPGSPYGQPTRTLDYCKAVYQKAGGFLRPVPDTVGVSKPNSTQPGYVENINTKATMDPLSLVSILTSAFAPLIRAKVEKAVGSDVGKPLADNLLALAQTATGKTDALEAVAVARQDPAIVAKLEQSAEDWFAQVAPFLDKIAQYDQAVWAAEIAGKNAASERAIRDKAAQLWDAAKVLVSNTEGQVWFVLVSLAAGVWGAFAYNKEGVAYALLTLSGPILGQIMKNKAQPNDYRWDGSKESAAQATAQNVVISEMAARK